MGDMAEYYDDREDETIPYSESEKRDLIKYYELKKEEDRIFYHNQGKFVIKNAHGLYLIDRHKNKNYWWSRYINDALILDTKEGAEKICSKLKYNAPSVIVINYDDSPGDYIDSDYDELIDKVRNNGDYDYTDKSNRLIDDGFLNDEGFSY